MNAWVENVIELLKKGDIDAAIAEVQASSNLADLQALEVAFRGITVQGALGFKVVLLRRIDELRVLAAAAAKASLVATAGPDPKI